MIPLTVGLVLLLCIQYVPLAEGNHKCTKNKELKLGFFDYYDCIRQCFFDTFGVTEVCGDLCDGDPSMSDDWGKVPFKSVKKCWKCITVNCRSSLPAPVCTRDNNGYRWTQEKTSYDSLDNQNGGNGRYSSSVDSGVYYYGNDNDQTATTYYNQREIPATAIANSFYSSDSSSSFFTPSSSTPFPMKRNKNTREENINNGNVKTSSNDSSWKSYFGNDNNSDVYEYNDYGDYDYGDYDSEDYGSGDFESGDYESGDNDSGDNGKGSKDKNKEKVGSGDTATNKTKYNNGTRVSSEDDEKKLVAAMKKYMIEDETQSQETNTTSSSTMLSSTSSPVETTSTGYTDITSSTGYTDIISSTEYSSSSSKGSFNTTKLFTDTTVTESTTYATAIAASSTYAPTIAESSTYATAIAESSSDVTSDYFDDYYDYYDDDDDDASSSSTSNSNCSTISTESNPVSTNDYDFGSTSFSSSSDAPVYFNSESYPNTDTSEPIWVVTVSDKGSTDEAGAPKYIGKTKNWQNRKDGSKSAQYPTYNEGNLPDDGNYNDGNSAGYNENEQQGYGRRGNQVTGGNAGNGYNYYYAYNPEGAAVPNDYWYLGQNNQGIPINPYNSNPSPTRAPDRPGRFWGGSGSSGGQPTFNSADSRNGPSSGRANANSESNSRNGPPGGYADTYRESNSGYEEPGGYADRYRESNSGNGQPGGYSNEYSAFGLRNVPPGRQANAYSTSYSRNEPSGRYTNARSASSRNRWPRRYAKAYRPYDSRNRWPRRYANAYSASKSRSRYYNRFQPRARPTNRQRTKRKQSLD